MTCKAYISMCSHTVSLQTNKSSIETTFETTAQRNNSVPLQKNHKKQQQKKTARTFFFLFNLLFTY